MKNLIIDRATLISVRTFENRIEKYTIPNGISLETVSSVLKEIYPNGYDRVYLEETVGIIGFKNEKEI